MFIGAYRLRQRGVCGPLNISHGINREGSSAVNTSTRGEAGTDLNLLSHSQGILWYVCRDGEGAGGWSGVTVWGPVLITNSWGEGSGSDTEFFLKGEGGRGGGGGPGKCKKS